MSVLMWKRSNELYFPSAACRDAILLDAVRCPIDGYDKMVYIFYLFFTCVHAALFYSNSHNTYANICKGHQYFHK